MSKNVKNTVDASALFRALLSGLLSGGGFIDMILQIINTPGALLKMVQDRFKGDIGEIDETFLTQFACALYHACITYRYEMFAEMGGVFNVAWNLARQNPEDCTPAKMLAYFQDGFGIHSQTMRNAITEGVIIKIGKLLLVDWMINGEPDEQTMRIDIHGYFDVAMDDEGIILDKTAMRQEAKVYVESLADDELSEMPDELLERIRSWQPIDNQQTSE